jgi:hypothetical protein
MLTRQFMISLMFGTPISTTETHVKKKHVYVGVGSIYGYIVH